MAKPRSKYTCQQCGLISPQYLGKCPECGEWNSLVETVEAPVPSRGKGTSVHKTGSQTTPIHLTDITHKKVMRIPTNISELDYVLGGGIVPGQVILLAGEPGVGKSTLLLQTVDSLAQSSSILYASGEESPQQISLRAKRLGIKGTGKTTSLKLFAETNVEAILSQMGSTDTTSETASDQLLIIDSIQTMWSSDLTGAPGSVGQVRECTYKLIQAAKSLHIPIIIVGQVTKEGSIAGPKVLEHLVDTVLYLEGARFEETKLLRVSKNRFGPTDEVGVFTMSEKGLRGVSNPSESFISKRDAPVPGQSTAVVLEGTRPIVVEVQALVAPSELKNPRRVGTGVNLNRLLMLCAILAKHLRLPLERFDVYVNVSGGLRVDEPGADLAIALAIYSSTKNKPLPPKSVAIGELSLLGDIQEASQQGRRVKEAKKLGFNKVLSHDTYTTISSLVSKLR